MPKLYFSFDGRKNELTLDIDQENIGSEPDLLVSSRDGQHQFKLTFINNAERVRFAKGIGMCRCLNENNEEVYISACI